MKVCDKCRSPLAGSRCHRCNSSQRSRRCERCGREAYGLRGPNKGERAICRFCRQKGI